MFYSEAIKHLYKNSSFNEKNAYSYHLNMTTIKNVK